jgi:hypothetical protein
MDVRWRSAEKVPRECGGGGERQEGGKQQVRWHHTGGPGKHLTIYSIINSWQIGKQLSQQNIAKIFSIMRSSLALKMPLLSCVVLLFCWQLPQISSAPIKKGQLAN